MNQKIIKRPFHSTVGWLIYPDVSSEFESPNSEELTGDNSNRSAIIKKEIESNKSQATEVRKDLMTHLTILNKFSNSRLSSARMKDAAFDQHVFVEEKQVTKAHDDSYNTPKSKPLYEDQINEAWIRKAVFCVSKSEASADIMGTNITEEEKQTIDAVKGLTKDIFKLRENRFELFKLKKAHDDQLANSSTNSGSLIDDYANVSTEIPDYTGGDD